MAGQGRSGRLHHAAQSAIGLSTIAIYSNRGTGQQRSPSTLTGSAGAEAVFVLLLADQALAGALALRGAGADGAPPGRVVREACVKGVQTRISSVT